MKLTSKFHLVLQTQWIWLDISCYLILRKWLMFSTLCLWKQEDRKTKGWGGGGKKLRDVDWSSKSCYVSIVKITILLKQNKCSSLHSHENIINSSGTLKSYADEILKESWLCVIHQIRAFLNFADNTENSLQAAQSYSSIRFRRKGKLVSIEHYVWSMKSFILSHSGLKAKGWWFHKVLQL